jgi:mRNA interferase MazF
MPTYRWVVFEAQLDPARDSEQKGTRLVLVVSNEEFNHTMPNVTVLPLTTTARRLYPSEVFLPRGAAGQPRDSIVMAHQIRTISKQRLGNRFGSLEDARVRAQILEAMREHLDLGGDAELA